MPDNNSDNNYRSFSPFLSNGRAGKGREGIARLESNPFGGPPAKGLVGRWIAVAQRLVRGEKEEEEEDDTGAAFIAA